MIKRVYYLIMTIAMVVSFTSGCNNQESGMSSKVIDPVKSAVQNGPESPIDVGGEILNAGILTDAIENRLDQAWANSFVQGEVAHFPGYTYDRKYSYIIEGQYVPDSTTDTFFVEIISLAMKYMPDSMQRVGNISVINVTGIGTIFQSSIVSFVVENSEDYELIEDAGVWVKTFPASGATTSVRSAAKRTWDWKAWSDCTISRTAAFCSAVATRCIFAGPGYFKCLAVGCAAGAVGAAVSCAVDQILASGIDDGECYGCW